MTNRIKSGISKIMVVYIVDSNRVTHMATKKLSQFTLVARTVLRWSEKRVKFIYKHLFVRHQLCLVVSISRCDGVLCGYLYAQSGHS